MSTRNALLFTPMLGEVASGGLEAQHITAALGAACPRTEVRRGEVVSVDPEAGEIRVRRSPETLAYDHLVMALPVLLGGSPQWSAPAATAVFASLVGHLAYGAALGIVFQRLEARYNPWWMTRTDIQAERAQLRAARLSASGPVLWALVVLLTACLPLLLGA